MSNSGVFSQSIGRKIAMGLTGLFLISFLAVHCFLNALIFFNDNGVTFNKDYTAEQKGIVGNAD